MACTLISACIELVWDRVSQYFWFSTKALELYFAGNHLLFFWKRIHQFFFIARQIALKRCWQNNAVSVSFQLLLLFNLFQYNGFPIPAALGTLSMVVITSSYSQNFCSNPIYKVAILQNFPTLLRSILKFLLLRHTSLHVSWPSPTTAPISIKYHFTHLHRPVYIWTGKFPLIGGC